MGGLYGQNKRIKINFLQTIFFIALVLLVGFVLLHSSIFTIKKITVTNNQSLSEQEIINISGISKGRNIFKEKISLAEDKLNLLPIIKQVEIERKLPSTITINVRERKAILLLVNGNELNEIDQDGILLKKSNNVGQNGLPIITGLNLTKNKGVGQAYNSEKLKQVISLVQLFPQNILEIFSEININSENQVIIYTVGGMQIKFGIIEDVKQKVELIKKLWADIGDINSRVLYLDISYYNSPVIKYKE